MILNSFARYKVSTTISRETIPEPIGGVPQPPTWATVATKKALKWDTAFVRTFVSDKYVTDVDAIFVYDVGEDVRQGDEITLGTNVYSVKHTDNIGMAGEALLVGVQELPNGTA